MKLAIVYAGQGSQHPGMGRDVYEAFPAFREAFDAAREQLGFDLHKVCFEDPDGILNETQYTQPCMVAFAAGITAVLQQAGIRPDYLAGLSLGEYSALQAAGVFGPAQAVLLAVTLGPGVDAQIRRAGVGDIAAGVASDALGSALAEQTADAAEAELRQLAAAEGTYLTGRFSPGYGDWDIAVQPLVAAALDTARRAGLCVTDTNLMTPRKSVTAILGVSDHPVKGHLAGCGHCVLRTRCEYRKRGKTCASE